MRRVSSAVQPFTFHVDGSSCSRYTSSGTPSRDESRERSPLIISVVLNNSSMKGSGNRTRSMPSYPPAVIPALRTSSTLPPPSEPHPVETADRAQVGGIPSILPIAFSQRTITLLRTHNHLRARTITSAPTSRHRRSSSAQSSPSR